MALISGWVAPVQEASFAGVKFDVLSVGDEFQRALAEHAYPFVNGADLEALGLEPLTVSLSAVFWGDGYFTDFKRFLKVLESNEPDVLMHPIRGRLSNMLCVSSRFRHEADNVNYVALDLEFKEASPAKPIFLFENSVVTAIDRLSLQLDGYLEQALNLYGLIMEGVAYGNNVKKTVLGLWRAVYGTFNSVRQLFDFDNSRFAISSSVSATTNTYGNSGNVGVNTTQIQTAQALREQFVEAATQLSQMLEEGLQDVVASSVSDSEEDSQSAVQMAEVFSTFSRFDEVLRTVQQVCAIPSDMVKGKENAPSVNEVKAVINGESQEKSALRLSHGNIVELHCVLCVLCAGEVAKIATQLIEENYEYMLPSEIERICTESRLVLLDALNEVRQLQAREDSSRGETGIYTSAQKLADYLRDVAHQLTQLTISAINQKPPLVVRLAPISGTLVQQAHALYGDYSRGAELLRLNPHICYPNFIRKGTVLNGYYQ